MGFAGWFLCVLLLLKIIVSLKWGYVDVFEVCEYAFSKFNYLLGWKGAMWVFWCI